MRVIHGGYAFLQETIVYRRFWLSIEEETARKMGKQFGLTWTPPSCKSIVVEDLIGILQDCVDDSNLPTSIRHIRACAHKCWPNINVSWYSLERVC